MWNTKLMNVNILIFTFFTLFASTTIFLNNLIQSFTTLFVSLKLFSTIITLEPNIRSYRCFLIRLYKLASDYHFAFSTEIFFVSSHFINFILSYLELLEMFVFSSSGWRLSNELIMFGA